MPADTKGETNVRRWRKVRDTVISTAVMGMTVHVRLAAASTR
jgi:hypothetical protein